MIGFDPSGNVMGGPGSLADDEAFSGADNTSVLNVSPTNQSTTQSSIKKSAQSLLYDPRKPAIGSTHEDLYRGRRAAMKAAGVTYGTQAYKDWDAATRSLMGVGSKDKFSSGNWMSTFGGLTQEEINEEIGNVEYYLDDSTSFRKDKPLSSWAVGQTPVAYMTDKQVTQKVLEEAFKSGKMNAFMVAGLKMKRGGNLPADQVAQIEGIRQGPHGSYNSFFDRMRMNYAMEDAEWAATPFHELAGHRLPDQLPDEFYDQQMPNIQALYETGGSQIAPDHVAPYGFDPSQGEMITSRAAQVRDLFELNAPIHEDSTGYYRGMGWKNLSDFMQKNPATRSKFVGSPEYNPNKNLTNLEELGYNRQLARDYENYARFNQELFGRNLGGDPRSAFNTKQQVMDYGNVPVGEETWIEDKWSGLFNHPLISNHFLVDRLLARNPEMVGTEMESVIENEYNAAIASPESVINKLSRYGLAEEFWDKVEDYITAESEDWSPSRARAEIRNILGGQ